METSSDPTLRLAIAAWRASLPPMPDDSVAELESHLLDSAAEMQKTGLSASEAFLIARRRLGHPSEFAEESAYAHALPQPVAPANAIARRTQMPTNACAKALTTLGVAALLAAIALPLWFTFTPYSASVMIEILRTPTIYEFGAFKNSPAPDDSRSGPDNEFLATQIQIVTALETSLRVASGRRLAKRWRLENDAQAARRLQGMLTTNAVPGTNLVRVTVRSPDREEVRGLAEDVANAYIERRMQVESIDLVHYTFTEKRTRQELIVEKARTKMYQLAEELNISDAAPDGPLYAARSGDQVAPARTVPYNKAKADYQLQYKILGEITQAEEDARLTNLMPRSPATFHEHATVPPERFLNSAVGWRIAAGSGGVGVLLLVLGYLRQRRRPRGKSESAASPALEVRC